MSLCLGLARLDGLRALSAIAVHEDATVKKIPKAIDKTADELQDEIRKREIAIDLLDEGEVKQRLRVRLAQLRSTAEQCTPPASDKPTA
jgi:hypothetical protein